MAATATPRADPSRTDDSGIDDDRLRLMFTCCHPALSMDAQVALTLRTLAGLTTPEIARAFLVPEATMAQRLVRAKRKIAQRRHPLPGTARSSPAGRARRRSWPSSTCSSTRATRRQPDRDLVRVTCATRRSAWPGC